MIRTPSISSPNAANTVRRFFKPALRFSPGNVLDAPADAPSLGARPLPDHTKGNS